MLEYKKEDTKVFSFFVCKNVQVKYQFIKTCTKKECLNVLKLKIKILYGSIQIR